MLTNANIAEKKTSPSLLTNADIGRHFDRASAEGEVASVCRGGKTITIDNSVILANPSIGEKMMVIYGIQH
jgi:hypothetical protein